MAQGRTPVRKPVRDLISIPQCNQPPFTHPLFPSHPHLLAVETGKRICTAAVGMITGMPLEAPAMLEVIEVLLRRESRDTREIRVSRRD